MTIRERLHAAIRRADAAGAANLPQCGFPSWPHDFCTLPCDIIAAEFEQSASAPQPPSPQGTAGERSECNGSGCPCRTGKAGILCRPCTDAECKDLNFSDPCRVPVAPPAPATAGPAEREPRDVCKELDELIAKAGGEAYFVPPPGKANHCKCTWPDGCPGMPRLSADCPIPQHERLARERDAKATGPAVAGKGPRDCELGSSCPGAAGVRPCAKCGRWTEEVSDSLADRMARWLTMAVRLPVPARADIGRFVSEVAALEARLAGSSNQDDVSAACIRDLYADIVDLRAKLATSEAIAAKAGEELDELRERLDMAERTTEAAQPSAGEVASRGSVPDGFVLAKGWEVIRGVSYQWGCSVPKDGDHCNRRARYRATTEDKRDPNWMAGACEEVAHAVEMRAIVRKVSAVTPKREGEGL